MDENTEACLARSADELAGYGEDAMMLAEHLAIRLAEPEMRAFWRSVMALLEQRAARAID